MSNPLLKQIGAI